MKKWIGIVLCLFPFVAYAEQTYTNEDLKRFSVPGAYTNEDLRKLPRLPVVKAAPVAPAPVPVAGPAAEPLQMRLDLLSEQRLIVQTELDWREAMVRKADSYFEKGPNEGPYLGYRSKSKGTIQYLELQRAILDARIDRVLDEARTEGVILEAR
jgi:hypothetical protein